MRALSLRYVKTPADVIPGVGEGDGKFESLLLPEQPGLMLRISIAVTAAVRKREGDVLLIGDSSFVPKVSVPHLLFIVPAIRDRRVRKYRYHGMLIVHLRFNTLTRLNVTRLQGDGVDMQPYRFAVLPLDETVIAFNAQHFKATT